MKNFKKKLLKKKSNDENKNGVKEEVSNDSETEASKEIPIESDPVVEVADTTVEPIENEKEVPLADTEAPFNVEAPVNDKSDDLPVVEVITTAQ